MFALRERRAFTLIELLIVIAILAILAFIVILALRPVEFFNQGRDAKRLAETDLIKSSIILMQVTLANVSLGSPNIVYTSLPSLDNDNDCLDDYPNLLPLAPPWQYFCARKADYRKIDGTGWLPVNFLGSSVTPLETLPVDPVNDAKLGFYYTYVTDGNRWELNEQMQSGRYEFDGDRDAESTDGGNTVVLREIGTNLLLAPKEVSWRTGTEIKVNNGVEPPPCADDFTGTGWDDEFYSPWIVGSTATKKAAITKVFLWKTDSSSHGFPDTSSLEIAVYDGSSPYPKISKGRTTMSGTSTAQTWLSVVLEEPVPITLGTRYIFGIGPNSGTYDIAMDFFGDCPEYLPNKLTFPTYVKFGDGGALDNQVPTAVTDTSHVGIFGVTYAR